MVSTGIWEAWTKLIWFSPQKQLPFISHWPCSGAWQTTFGVCSMCVDYSWPILLYSSPISATNFTFRNFLIQNLGVNSYDLMFLIWLLQFPWNPYCSNSYFGRLLCISVLRLCSFYSDRHARLAADSHGFEAGEHSSGIVWIYQNTWL